MDKKVNASVKNYLKAVKKIMTPQMVILYGSYARGNPHEYSDIDIAVVVKKIGRNYFNVCEKLTGLVWDIDTRIEPLLLESEADKSGFLDSILKYGKIIYKKGKGLHENYL